MEPVPRIAECCHPSHWRLTYSPVVVSLQEHESFLIGQASIQMYLMHRPGFELLPWKKRRTEVTAVLDVQLSLQKVTEMHTE